MALIEKEYDEVLDLITKHFKEKKDKLTPLEFSIFLIRELKDNKFELSKTKTDFYLMQKVNAGYIGNSPMFWAKNGGYTQWLDEAKLFCLQEAEATIRSTSGTHQWVLWPTGDICKHKRVTLDIQDFTIENGVARSIKVDKGDSDALTRWAEETKAT